MDEGSRRQAEDEPNGQQITPRERRRTYADHMRDMAGEFPPLRVRHRHLGTVRTELAAGATDVLAFDPMGIFRVTRIVLPSSIGYDVDVTFVRLGEREAFKGPTLALFFSELVTIPDVDWGAVEFGDQIKVGVRNTSSRGAQIDMAVYGVRAGEPL